MQIAADSSNQEYCLRNDIVFNASKTKCFTRGKHKYEVNVPANFQKVQATSWANDLGSAT